MQLGLLSVEYYEEKYYIIYFEDDYSTSNSFLLSDCFELNRLTCCCWCGFDCNPADTLLLEYWEGEQASLETPALEEEPGV